MKEQNMKAQNMKEQNVKEQNAKEQNMRDQTERHESYKDTWGSNYGTRYEHMTEEEKNRNYLAIDLDLIIGGKAELLFEILSYLDFEKREPSLILQRLVKDLRTELGMSAE